MKRLTPYLLGAILICVAAYGLLYPYIQAYSAQARAVSEGIQFMDANDLRLEGKHLGLACITKEGTEERVCPDLIFTPTKEIKGDNVIYVVQENDVVYLGNAADPTSADILKKPGAKLYEVSYKEDTGANWLPEPAMAAEEYLIVWCSNYLAATEGIICSQTYSVLH